MGTDELAMGLEVAIEVAAETIKLNLKRGLALWFKASGRWKTHRAIPRGERLRTHCRDSLSNSADGGVVGQHRTRSSDGLRLTAREQADEPGSIHSSWQLASVASCCNSGVGFDRKQIAVNIRALRLYWTAPV
jgi:hypothetical protein